MGTKGDPSQPSHAQTAAVLAPYLPQLVIDWLEDAPELRARTIAGTCVFADISGFTSLTEKLARKGQVGAEEMGDTLNLIFGALLGAAYDLGAALLKWGGDAVLVLFEGPDHAARAAAAAYQMQRDMARIGRVRTSGGTVRLRMSIGMHSGDLDFLLVGEVFRELIITGPGASLVARMETAADPGEVVLSPESARAVAAAGGKIGPAKGLGFVLDKPPVFSGDLQLKARRPTSVDLTMALPRQLADHILGGEVAYEHRTVAICFLEFSGVDALRESVGLDAVASAVGRVIDSCQRAALDHDVMVLSSDIYPDGGKVILIAGAPLNTGDDATRVLTAARQVLASDQELAIRGGVNLGRVFAGDYGPSFRRVYSVIGDCVNLAARLMAKGATGDLIASDEVLAASRTAFVTRRLEPFLVKGKSEPVRARVVGSPLAERQAPASAHLRLIGRSRELGLLAAAWEGVMDGAGHLIDLVGEPGVGKSRLLQELVDTSGLTPVWLDGNIYATQTPYEPFRRLFVDRIAIDPLRADAGERLTALVADLDPGLVPWLPLIGIVAGIDFPETDEVRALDAGSRKARLEAATSAVLGRLLVDPTMIVFNDVDFMDEASTDLLDRLAADAVDRPWLLVASRRPSALWRPPADVRLTSLALDSLGPAAADELLAAALTRGPLPPHRMAELVERSGGNPLFLTELASGLGRGLDPDAVPDTVEGILAARIDRLPPASRALLRIAAVIGVRVSRDLLAAVVGRTPGLARLATLATIDDLLDASGETLLFTHGLIRETAYLGLPVRTRKDLHATVADVLLESAVTRANEPALLSLHCFHAGRYSDALEFSARAAETAYRQYATAEAVDNYQRAISAGLRLPPKERDSQRLGELWLSLCQVNEELGDLEAMGRAAKHARMLVKGDPLREARVAELTAVHRRMVGDYPGSLRWITLGLRALDGLESPEARSMRGMFYERYARNRLSQGQLRDSVRWADRAVAESRAADDRRGEAHAIETRSVAQSNAGIRVDLEEATRAVDLWTAERDISRVARTYNVVGVLAFNQGEWVRALDHYRASAESYERLGRPIDVALQLTNQAEILVFQGCLDEADEMLERARPLLRAATGTTEYAFALGQAGRVAMARSDHDRAQDLYAQARTIQVAVGDQYEVVILDGLSAEAHLLAGDGATALQMLAVVEVDNRTVGAPLDYLARIEGLAHIACGRHDEGVRVLRDALDASRRRNEPYDEWRLLVALIELGEATQADRSALRDLEPVLRGQLGIRLPASEAGG